MVKNRVCITRWRHRTSARCWRSDGASKENLHFDHSRPQRPRSFWSAPRIATSGPVQRHSGFEWLWKHNRLRPEPIRFVRLDSEHAQSDGKSENRRECILIIKVNKLFSFFLSRCFLKKKYKTCTPYFYRVIQTLVKVWENSKKLWKHSPAARVPTAFLVTPNFHSCLYNSIETRYMFSIY